MEPAGGLVPVTCYPFEAVDTAGPLRYVVTVLLDDPRCVEDGRAILRHALGGRR